MVRPDATSHKKKHILTALNYKADAIIKILGELNEMTRKFMAQVKSMEPADVAHKSLPEQETADLEAGFQNYEEIGHVFLRANSEFLHRIYTKVNKSDMFVVQDVSRPVAEQVVK